MAKLKFGMMVTEASGKLGGHVFARNRSGAYVRTKVTPVNPQTIAQQHSRALLSSFSQLWRSLSQTQRNAWNAAVADFAKTDVFGDLRNPTGKNLYSLLNINLINAGQAGISEPPTPSTIETFMLTGMTSNNAMSELEIDFPAGGPLSTILIFATASVSPGISFVKNRFRLIGTLPGSTVGPANVYADYVAKFGQPTIGQKVFVKLVGVNNQTGQQSSPSQNFVTIA